MSAVLAEPPPLPHADAACPARDVGADAPVCLLDAEPDLAAGLAHDELAIARRHLVVPGVRIAAGTWTPAEDVARGIMVLVVSGMLLRESGVLDVRDVQLLGPGDLVDPRLFADSTSSWLVLAPAHLAILDARVVVVARRWPQMIPRLTERLFDGHHEHRLLATIRALPRVEERVLGLLTHLATRWGHVTPDGLTLALPVTHELLGRLVGARRPTISLALADLKDGGLLRRLQDGRWLLPSQRGAPFASVT